MLVLLHDRYGNRDLLARQVAELRRLPSAERLVMVAESPAAAEAQGLEWCAAANGGSLTRLARLSGGQPIVKLNDCGVVTAETLERLIAAHAKAQRPVTVFCPGPNDFVYTPTALIELFEPARMTRARLVERLNTLVRTRMLGWVQANRAMLRSKVPVSLYRAARYHFYRWHDVSHKEADGDVIIRPVVELSDPDIPLEDVHVYTGSVEDKLRYAVQRVRDFFPFPKDVHYVLTNLCNLRCVMCPYHSETARAVRKTSFFDRAAFTPLEDFCRVAEEVGRYGATLRFGQLEEALYHKQLEQFVAIARRVGVPDVHLTTNGTLLTPQRAERLLDAGLTSVAVSVDAVTEDTYRQIRIGGDFKTVVENTRQLIRLRDRKRTRTVLRVSMILQGAAIEEKERFIQFWRDEGIDQVTVYQLSEYDSSGRIIFKKTFYDQAAFGRYACGAPWLEAFVYPGGEVSLCCWTLELVPTKGVLAVGNVREKPLSEIWVSDVYQRVREQLITNRFRDAITREACNDCFVWSSSTYRRRHEGNGTSVLYNESMETYEFA